MIFAKWLRSLKYGNDFFKIHDSESYFFNYHNYLEKLLSRVNIKIKLAVLSDNHDIVLGWACTEPSILHYVWVDPAQREQGIAKQLCSEQFKIVTHLTNVGARIFSRLKDVKFNAFS